jgi:excisionase family DNA binding protein
VDLYGDCMEPLYTTHDVAKLIQVDPATVSKWIDKSILVAFRTPGGHRRVRQSDLRAFLQTHQMPIPSELGGGSFKLLVADDEKPVIEALKRSLRKQAPQIEVLGVTSGIEAVLTLAEERPHAALIDLNMPDVDGLEVCRRVRDRKSLEGVQLVTMTSRLTPDAIQRSREAGAVECLGKPVDAAGLISLFKSSIAFAGS